ncbi:MAG TPA: hypothetical protein PKC13_27495 [Blastocatellia bacterium]|nr:hypothetical protein [Blastocatellia bacterium]HMX29361.1 hypothetical protein [Blastocatellia bacterium]
MQKRSLLLSIPMLVGVMALATFFMRGGQARIIKGALFGVSLPNSTVCANGKNYSECVKTDKTGAFTFACTDDAPAKCPPSTGTINVFNQQCPKCGLNLDATKPSGKLTVLCRPGCVTADPVKPNAKASESDRLTQPVLDLTGKELRRGEHYLAELTDKDGKIIAYRKNQREVAALVKTLKEGGVSDQRLLTPQTWLATSCDLTGPKTCANVHCGQNAYCHLQQAGHEIYKIPPGIKETWATFGYCTCLK